MRDGKRIARAYSLVNSPDCPYLEVLAVAVDEGELSPDLQSLSIDDEIEVSTKATGFMTLNEIPAFEGKPQDIWFLATGTAVGPFISMMRDKTLWSRFEHVVLVYGVRHLCDLAYFDELLQFESTHSNFKLITAVTREHHEFGLSCRIPEGIASGAVELAAGLNLNADKSQVMICGNPEMITDAQKVLNDKGLVKNLRRAPGQITVEKYW